MAGTPAFASGIHLKERAMSLSEQKKRTLHSSANLAISKAVARAARFTEADGFRRSLVMALDKHPGFSNAVEAFHTHALSGKAPGKGQVARTVVPAGRVQAPRRDTPKGRSF
jgi:hypothetical protein